MKNKKTKKKVNIQKQTNKKIVSKKNVNSNILKNKQSKRKKVRKLRYGRIFLLIVILIIIFCLISSILNISIKNIYIHGNNLVSDYEIIEIAHLEDYPSMFYEFGSSIEKRLEENIYIRKAIVRKSFRRIDITITDNYPVLYNNNTKKTIFQDKRENDKVYSVPILVNYVPDTIMDDFINKFISLDIEVINRISEIKYDPNNVDSERFLLTMNDGNFVYLTLYDFDKMNSYISIYLDIISKYGQKRGILYLDSGGYFKIIK